MMNLDGNIASNSNMISALKYLLYKTNLKNVMISMRYCEIDGLLLKKLIDNLESQSTGNLMDCIYMNLSYNPILKFKQELGIMNIISNNCIEFY